MDRREFLKISGLGALALVLSSCGFSKQTASSAQLTGGGSSATGKEKVAGTGGDKYIPPEQRQGNESVVYFTRDLSAAGLLKIYETIAGNMTGRVGIKLHTGEPHGPNIIPRPWVKQLMEAKLPNARIVETNTYYGGARYTTEEHRKTLAVNGWDFAPVDILDEEGTTMLPVKGGKWFTEMSVGSHLLNYDSLLVLTHFKGHTMGGFGGSDKNIGIGCADGRIGKKMIHSGEGGSQWGIDKEEFMERLTESSKATADHFGNHIAYINVLRNMSVSCDCEGTGAQPVVTPKHRYPGVHGHPGGRSGFRRPGLCPAGKRSPRPGGTDGKPPRPAPAELHEGTGHGLRPVCAAGPGPWQPAPDPGGCGEGRKTLRGIKNS
nr:DUF362 domain-containing protein [uncultured Acidaminococcus sp.]